MRISWRALTLVVVAVGFIAACGNDNPPPPPPAVPVGAQPGQPAVPAVPAQPAQGMASNFGTVTLAPGFTPDPHVAEGTSGGAIQATTLNPSCQGWVSQTPDHILVASGAFANLRLLVNGADQDLTLVVQRPDGSFACNDDAEGVHPIVQGNFAPGNYKIWVGSYEQGVQARYKLGITELTSTTAAQLGGGAAAGGTSNFGTVSLSPGFMPDPTVVQGTSGGAIQAATWSPNCRGWVSPTPDHLLAAAGNFDLLRVLVRSSSDTTLVVQKPDGQYLCDDDTEGRNPVIAGQFAAGTYKIWVGSYRQGQNSAYHVGFSELSSTRTRNIR